MIQIVELLRRSKFKICYFILIIIVISFPLLNFPRIYGTDTFQVIWMAYALKNGALFSDQTWLIHPTSYFGYYPFSHRAIAVPMILAFLISLVNFLSFGYFGLSEAILLYNVLIILIIYKSARNLGKTLFRKQWIQFIFVSAILLSPDIVSDINMMVSTRIIITIITMILLNISLKIIKDKNNFNVKTFFKFILLILIGSLSHKLWLATFIIVGLTFFIILIEKYETFQRIIIFAIIPLSVIGFFIGLLVFTIDPIKIWSPFFDNSSLIGVIMNLIIHYFLDIGLIVIFFPLGVIVVIYEFFSSQKSNKETVINEVNKKYNKNNINIFLLLFLIPFLFSAPTFYSTTIFLPIIIILSLKGLIKAKNLIRFFNKKFKLLIISFISLIISTIYSVLYINIYIFVDLWYLFLIILLSIIIIISILFLKRFHYILFPRISFNFIKMQKIFAIFMIISSILIFATTTVVGRYREIETSPYPWENRYLTDQEIEIADFFQNIEINGFIFVVDSYISTRLEAYAFIPTIAIRMYPPILNILTPLYYGLLTPEEVHKYTIFSLSQLSTLNFFYYIGDDPIRDMALSIKDLNLQYEGDYEFLNSVYKVKYIISVKSNFIHYSNNWTIVKSLYEVGLEPIFSTVNLLVWEI